MSKNNVVRRSVSVLALGAALSIGAITAPVAMAAPGETPTEAKKVVDALNSVAESSSDISNALDSFLGDIDKVFGNKDVASQLNLNKQDIVALQKFLAELDKNKDNLEKVVIAVRDVQDKVDKVEAKSDTADINTGALELKAQFNNERSESVVIDKLTAEVVASLREALIDSTADSKTTQNIDIDAQKAAVKVGSTSVSIVVNPDCTGTVDINGVGAGSGSDDDNADDDSDNDSDDSDNDSDDNKDEDGDNDTDKDEDGDNDTDKDEDKDTDAPISK